MQIELSPLDLQRFGVITAKAALSEAGQTGAALDWCARHQVALLIARCPGSDLAQVQALEQAGAYLTDTLVYYRKQKLAEHAVALPAGYRARPATPDDAEAVELLAGQTFQGYFGHYHADPRLNPADADLVYSSWAGHSCRNRAVADAVLLIEHGEQIVAFATLKRRGEDTPEAELEGVLFGVHPLHQGQRLYHALMQLAQNWAIAAGLDQMLVSTQLTNLSVQKVWCRQGFEPCGSSYTFHHWF
ncbi:GNAT family N-acetyltransferase [Oxalobacteraceae bacterium]|nr:GNAT family N-acetyltransferase [Oxalobacteraceae bacterium]